MAALLEAYITNLGKYAEGQLVGETLKFPTTAEEVQSLLKRIGVDGIRYEEIFITSFDGDVLGLHEHLGEYESIDELNYLAALLSEINRHMLRANIIPAKDFFLLFSKHRILRHAATSTAHHTRPRIRSQRRRFPQRWGP